MSRSPDVHREPGPECFCGSELRSVPLPADLAALAGREQIWVHEHNGDTRCYPDAASADDRAATGEPAEAESAVRAQLEPPMDTPEQVADELFRRAFGRFP